MTSRKKGENRTNDSELHFELAFDSLIKVEHCYLDTLSTSLIRGLPSIETERCNNFLIIRVVPFAYLDVGEMPLTSLNIVGPYLASQLETKDFGPS